jgi:hypothetical protein
MAGSDVSALEVAGSVPLASAAMGRRGMLATSASSPPDPASSARAASSEVEVEKSVDMGMASLKQLSRFGTDSTPEVALPKESAVPPPLVTKAPGSTTGAGADAGA